MDRKYIFKIFCLSIFSFIFLNYCEESDKFNNECSIERIVLNYTHSLRIPHHQIKFTLYKTLDNNESYKMDIETFAMIYEEPPWNIDDENTREYIESEEYKNSKIQLINTIEKYSEENISKTIDIDKEFFLIINEKILKIDSQKIFQENKSTFMLIDGNIRRKIGNDGSDVTIQYGTLQYYMSIRVWNPKNTPGEASKVNDIVLEIFKKANMNEWYE